eukprot:TRINITY_DN5609_c0_g1_i9.p1 TRINITY_DN5609_c0_g1~~TRINITY_DN5609_c0_g1_i9.p1  ORF type:complete len:164 (-),score=21.53 TRINITY_DN5609_c0_g1_i9:318-809(-)
MINDKNFPLLCPSPDCRTEVSESDLQVFMSASELQKYEEFLLSSFVETNSQDYSCCPTPDCSYYFFYKDGEFDFICPRCKKRYCLKCKVEYHSECSCEEYQKWSVENGLADDKFYEFVYGSKCKQCRKCKKWVQKNSGCNHITCRCGSQFCYLCGGKWPCNAC